MRVLISSVKVFIVTIVIILSINFLGNISSSHLMHNITSSQTLYAQNFEPNTNLQKADISTIYSIIDSLAEDSVKIYSPPDSLPNHLNRKVENNAFRIGEKLRFKIRYGFIKAGEATMEVKDIITIRDSVPVYHILTTAKSTKAFDLVYKVRDSVETFIDMNGLFSWKFYKRLREGGYKMDLLAEYNHRYGIANVKKIRYHSDEPLRVKNKETFYLSIPPYIVDILASFYYVRTQDLRVGEPIYMTNHDNQKIYDLKVIVQKKERIKVDAGEFNCVVVIPRLKGEAIFKQKGELWVWLTDDEYKIPVQMKSKVAVGSITTELTDIEGVPQPIKAQVD
ncbi:MAG: DUF3108 domain-containing protein [Aliifodinibius sp.]|nr:DUF3108 domain-containing protein [Fodinibius sp.]